jgi:hypothetical protein
MGRLVVWLEMQKEVQVLLVTEKARLQPRLICPEGVERLLLLSSVPEDGRCEESCVVGVRGNCLAGVRCIVTLECTEARAEGGTPSRYTTQKVQQRPLHCQLQRLSRSKSPQRRAASLSIRSHEHEAEDHS